MQGKLCYPCAILHNQHYPYKGKTALPEVFLFADIAFDRPAIEESTDIEE